MKKIKIIFLLFGFIILAGCNNSNNSLENKDEIDIKDMLIERYPIITDASEYRGLLSYFGTTAYDRGLCTGERVSTLNNVDYCTITLEELKKELTNMDISILESYKGIKCRSDIVGVIIDLNNSSKEGVDVGLTLDYECLGEYVEY